MKRDELQRMEEPRAERHRPMRVPTRQCPVFPRHIILDDTAYTASNKNGLLCDHYYFMMNRTNKGTLCVVPAKDQRPIVRLCLQSIWCHNYWLSITYKKWEIAGVYVCMCQQKNEIWYNNCEFVISKRLPSDCHDSFTTDTEMVTGDKKRDHSDDISWYGHEEPVWSLQNYYLAIVQGDKNLKKEEYKMFLCAALPRRKVRRRTNKKPVM